MAIHAFDVIFMLDELISGGYREALTLQQIQSFVAMDSHEEKLQKMIAEVLPIYRILGCRTYGN